MALQPFFSIVRNMGFLNLYLISMLIISVVFLIVFLSEQDLPNDK